MPLIQQECVSCDDKGSPQCKGTNIVHNEVRYRGEQFSVSLVLVGYDFGTVTGSIYANVLSTGSYEQLGDKQHTHTANFRSCNALVYSVHSTDVYEIIKLTANEQENSKDEIENIDNNDQPTTMTLLTTPIYINVTLEDCPLGFRLNETLIMCECDNNLNNLSIDVTCEIRDHRGYINREGTLWVGVNQNENNIDTSNTYYLSNTGCPISYCKNERIAVDLTDLDLQCSNNHAGNLCSGCKFNYSLQLGTDRCAECKDDNELALLIFFVAAGFLLVFSSHFLTLLLPMEQSMD